MIENLFLCAQEKACNLLLNGQFHKSDLAYYLNIEVKRLNAFLYCPEPYKTEVKLYSKLLQIR